MRPTSLFALAVAVAVAVVAAAGVDARHDGTFTAGTHHNTALQTFNSLNNNLPLLTQWAANYKLTCGSPVKGVPLAPFTLKNFNGVAGTAAALLGCRTAPAADLDGWTKETLKFNGRKALRIEISNNEDNIWPVDREQNGPNLNPAAHNLAESLNALSGVNPPVYATVTQEVDLWAAGYKADEIVMRKLRAHFTKSGGMTINFPDNSGNPRQAHVLLPEDLIVQKANLVTMDVRQRKNDGVAWPNTNFAGGQRKFSNDAADLACECHHPKFELVVKDTTGATPYVKKICDIDWGRISTDVANLPLAQYNAWAHASLTAGTPMHLTAHAHRPASVQAMSVVAAAIESVPMVR